MYKDLLKDFLCKQTKRSDQYCYNILHGKDAVPGKSSKILIFTSDDLLEMLTLLRDNGCLQWEVIDVTSDDIREIL